MKSITASTILYLAVVCCAHPTTKQNDDIEQQKNQLKQVKQENPANPREHIFDDSSLSDIQDAQKMICKEISDLDELEDLNLLDELDDFTKDLEELYCSVYSDHTIADNEVIEEIASNISFDSFADFLSYLRHKDISNTSEVSHDFNTFFEPEHVIKDTLKELKESKETKEL